MDQNQRELSLDAIQATATYNVDPMEPVDLSDMPDDEFYALCPQGYHATGDA